MHKCQFYIGTSGWQYDDWRGVFYPEKLDKKHWLDYYVKYFNTVEVNATFYHTFKENIYKSWYEQSPAHFKYVLKLPRYISHIKRLHDIQVSLDQFMHSSSFLKEKLSLYLLQLPPNFSYDISRLDDAIQCFENTKKLVIEFRNDSWLRPDVYQLIRQYKSIFCAIDSPQSALSHWITSDIVYIRLHGKKDWYDYHYSKKELKEIINYAHDMIEKGAKKIYIFFNNDVNGYAVKNALMLKEMLGAD